MSDFEELRKQLGDDFERVKKLAEHLSAAAFCPECFGLVPQGQACPNGCDDIPDEVRYAAPAPPPKEWHQHLARDTQGGRGE